MHSEMETLERIKILRGLRKGEFDVLIGINLLREGSDCPRFRWWRCSTQTRKVSCVARVADPDHRTLRPQPEWTGDPLRRPHDGFDGTAIDETEPSSRHPAAYNEEHGITPRRSSARSICNGGHRHRGLYDLSDPKQKACRNSVRKLSSTPSSRNSEAICEKPPKVRVRKCGKLRDTIRELKTKEFFFA